MRCLEKNETKRKNEKKWGVDSLNYKTLHGSGSGSPLGGPKNPKYGLESDFMNISDILGIKEEILKYSPSPSLHFRCYSPSPVLTSFNFPILPHPVWTHKTPNHSRVLGSCMYVGLWLHNIPDDTFDHFISKEFQTGEDIDNLHSPSLCLSGHQPRSASHL